MATDKKHIAVYLAPEIEQALIAFCEQKGLKSKKGTMFSAGVNAALAEFFDVADTGESNIPATVGGNIPATVGGNIPTSLGHIPTELSNISATVSSNIPSGSLMVEVLPGKLQA